jgi:hypothetical protein
MEWSKKLTADDGKIDVLAEQSEYAISERLTNLEGAAYGALHLLRAMLTDSEVTCGPYINLLISVTAELESYFSFVRVRVPPET